MTCCCALSRADTPGLDCLRLSHSLKLGELMCLKRNDGSALLKVLVPIRPGNVYIEFVPPQQQYSHSTHPVCTPEPNEDRVSMIREWAPPPPNPWGRPIHWALWTATGIVVQSSEQAEC
eukprot:gene25859-biopygen10837